MRKVTVLAMCVLGGTLVFAAEKEGTKVINDFELDTDADMFKDSTADTLISGEHATRGKRSLKVTWKEGKPLSALGTMPEDWSGHAWFKFDLFLEGAEVNFTLRIKDKAGKTYDVWQYPMTGGANTVTVNLATAAEKIDLKQVAHFWLYIDNPEQWHTGYVDNVRLEK